MWLFDRFREVEIVRTGGQSGYERGAIVTQNGIRYRVTRTKCYPTTPWQTCVVYAVRV